MISEITSCRRKDDAPSVRAAPRSAFTLLEIIVVLTLLSILLGMSLRRIASAADRAAVRAATREAAGIFASARTAAIYRREPVAVTIDTVMGAVSSRSDSVALLRRDLRSAFGVRLSASRDSMAYDARGLGVGAANLSLVIRRGAAAETVFVSRLGRVRE
jgi:prepilin-type N-terminal cleavage/methylation domain-containing protein